MPVKVQVLSCPKCGASAHQLIEQVGGQLKPGTNLVACPFCDAALVIDVSRDETLTNVQDAVAAFADVRFDLENKIRTSYGVISEYQKTVQTSDRPEEKLRARRGIDAQWETIYGYLLEYKKVLGANSWSSDIVQIAAHFGNEF